MVPSFELAASSILVKRDTHRETEVAEGSTRFGRARNAHLEVIPVAPKTVKRARRLDRPRSRGEWAWVRRSSTAAGSLGVPLGTRLPAGRYRTLHPLSPCGRPWRTVHR